MEGAQPIKDNDIFLQPIRFETYTDHVIFPALVAPAFFACFDWFMLLFAAKVIVWL